LTTKGQREPPLAIMNDTFKVYMPLVAWEKADEANPLRIGGIVSTDTLDRQGEKVVQEGLDFSPFVNHGWFNDNHGQKTTDVLGYPTGVKRIRKGEKLPNGQVSDTSGWWAEGYLLDTDEGRKVYSLARSLQKTANRRIGFSIEGKVIKRDKQDHTTILAAEVRNVAVTHCPVNTDTHLHALAKALTAGSAVSAEGSSAGEGFALRTESMDGAEYDQNGRPKTKKSKKDSDDNPIVVQMHSGNDGDGGEPNNGGFAGTSPHLAKGESSADGPLDDWSVLEHVEYWAGAAQDFARAPVTTKMTKSEAFVIVAQRFPHLSADKVSAIVASAATENK